MGEENITITEEIYLKLGTDLLKKVGVPEEHARIQMGALLDADQKGVTTHGIFRLPRYVEQVHKGFVHSKPEIQFVKEGPIVKVLDADHGLGAVVSNLAMEEALNISSKKGVGVVAVRRSNHFGTAGYFAEMAAMRNQIGIVFTNTSPLIAPTGSKKPIVGNNPWSISAPSSLEHPITLDMANSIAARGKMRIAAQKGEQIPFGWALDREGQPTTDPLEAIKGIILPIGGHKGYGISLMIEILAGVLTGSDFGENMVNADDNQKRNVGHLFIALNIEHFMDMDEFKSRMDELIGAVKNAPRINEEQEVFLPGEIEWQKKELEQKNKYVQVSKKTFQSLSKLCSEFNIDISSIEQQLEEELK